MKLFVHLVLFFWVYLGTYEGMRHTLSDNAKLTVDELNEAKKNISKKALIMAIAVYLPFFAIIQYG